MTKPPPKNSRSVLTWVRDKGGLEHWQIDAYNKPIKWGDPGFWGEAKAWGQEVLYWREEPPPPTEEEMR